MIDQTGSKLTDAQIDAFLRRVHEERGAVIAAYRGEGKTCVIIGAKNKEGMAYCLAGILKKLDDHGISVGELLAILARSE